jgi:hypothetical protein
MAYALHGTQIFLNQGFTFAGIAFDDHSPVTWGVAGALVAGGFALCRPGLTRARAAWDEIAEQIKPQRSSTRPGAATEAAQ